MRLSKENQSLILAGEDLAKVFLELELVVVSLNRIGAYYANAPTTERSNYERETTRFIDSWRVTERLARARGIACRAFESRLGEDDMDDLERLSEAVEYWVSPQSEPPKR